MDAERKIVELVEALQKEIDPSRCEELATLIFKEIVPFLVVTIQGEVYDSEVHDVLSKTLEAIFKNFDKARAKSDKPFKAWCKGIAIHKAIDLRRKRRNKKHEDIETFSPKEIEASVMATILDRTTHSGDRLDYEWALKCLKALRPYCRGVLWKHFMDEFDLDELGVIMQKKTSALRVQLKRCIRELFEAYNES